MESIPNDSLQVLVVDDDAGLLSSIEASLISAGLPRPALVSDGRRVEYLIAQHGFQVVLLDLIMPHMGGMEVLEMIKSRFPEVECVIITAVDEVPMAVKAMKTGAFDYLVKPLERDRLILVVERALERYSMRKGLVPFPKSASFSDLNNKDAFSGMITQDPAMARVFLMAETASKTDYNLIITGETGTGKGMLARIIHDLSRRKTGPFVNVNMGAMNRNLIEDALFGHVRGAYTGATMERKGFFETADRGTLFLDEITELPIEQQVKLLSVIEEKELYKMGTTFVQKVDARIIAASNQDIREEMEKGRFREDLFYRLNMFHIHIPPLRERTGDIRLLTEHFCHVYAMKNDKTITSVSEGVVNLLKKYSFPGNIREMQNLIAGAVLMESTGTLTPGALKLPETRKMEDEYPQNRIPTLKEVEMNHIRKVLEHTGGNRTQAAAVLGIGIRTLRRKLNPQ